MARLAHVVDWAIGSIKIETYPMYRHFGWYPYARFTVYPTQYVTVKTDKGAIRDEGIISKRVTESVTVTRTISQAGMKIDSLISFDGIFFDENDNLVTPSFSVTASGMLECSIECNGTAIIEYYASVRLFEYDAEVETLPGGWKVPHVGIIWAYDQNATKNVTTYEIPIMQYGSTEQVRFARVFRNVIAADKLYEMPTTFTEAEISYVSYPAADTSELEADMRLDEITQEELLWDGVNVQIRDRHNPDWNYPTVDDVTGFLDVQWQISVNIPDELAGNTDITDAVAALQQKYGL